MRHGVTGTLVDFGRGAQVPYGELLEEILELIAEDAEALGCTAEVLHAREIVRRGTSADRQIATFDRMMKEAENPKAAFKAVVDEMVADTVLGLD